MLGQKLLLALVASILSPGVLAAPHDLSNQLMKRDPSSTLSVYNAMSVPSVKRADSADTTDASKEEASKEKDSKEAEKESKDEASKEKDSKDAEKDSKKAEKDKDSKGEAPKGEDSKGEAPKGEDSKGEAPKGEDSKGEASTASTPAAAPDAATDAAGNPLTQIIGDITSLDPLAAVSDLAAPVAGALPVKA